MFISVFNIIFLSILKSRISLLTFEVFDFLKLLNFDISLCYIFMLKKGYQNFFFDAASQVEKQVHK